MNMGISIGNTSLFDATTALAQNKGKTSALESKLNSMGDDSKDEDMLQACKDFETYLVQQMIESMKKTVPKSDEEGKNEYEEYFGDMLYESYAQSITESGQLGIAQQLYESMKRNQ